MTQAATERRFNDLTAVRRKHELARYRRARIRDIGPVHIRAGRPTVRIRGEVVPAPPRFPRWPMQRLGELLWRLVPPAVFKILEPQIDWEAVSKWLFNRRRAAGPGVR